MDHILLTRAITALTNPRSHVQIPGPSPQTAPSLESARGRGGTSVRVSPAAGTCRHCLLRLPGTLLTALLGTEQDPRCRTGTLSNNHRNAAASRFQCGSALCRHITSPFCTSGFSSYKGEENIHTQKREGGLRTEIAGATPETLQCSCKQPQNSRGGSSAAAARLTGT